MKMTFKPLSNESLNTFSVEVDEQGKLIKAEGIAQPAAAFHMRRGKGIDGLVRAYMHTHAAIEEDSEGGDDEVANGTILKSDDDRRLAFGWAYTSHDKDGRVVVDKSGEFIDDVRELEEAGYGFVKGSRTAGWMHSRDAQDNPIKVGELIESIVFTPEKIAKMGIPEGIIPQGAWWVGFHVDEAKWPDVKSGKVASFSISGKAIKKAVDP